MAAKTQPWFRLYSEVLTDRKIIRVAASSGQPKALIVGVWVTLLSMANDSPKRGYLLIADDMPIIREEIIAETGLGPETGGAILDAFLATNMLRLDGDCFVIVHWDERQFVSDTSAERVRNFRQRQKGETPQAAGEEFPPSNGVDPETIGYTNRYSNVTETPPDTESESESNGVGKKPPTPEVTKGPLSQLMNEFVVSSGIPEPQNKPDRKYWFSRLSVLYEIALRDIDIGKKLIRDSIDKLRAEELTISDPGSLVKTARSIQAKPKMKVSAF